MLPPNDARVTGMRCIEPASGSSAGLVAAGGPLVVAMCVEAGSALFGTGARFKAGVQVDGIELGSFGWRTGRLGDDDWPTAVTEILFRVPGEATAALGDRLVSVAGYVRVNAAPPFLVSAVRGPDVFVVPAAAGA